MSRGLKNLLFVLLGFGISIFFMSILAFFALVSFALPSVVVEKNSYLELNFSGKLVEAPLSEFSGLFAGRAVGEMEFIKYLKAIDMASRDRRIEGIVINGDKTFYNRAHVEEIREALDKFKKTGKPVYGWFSNGTNTNYSILLSADKIYAPDTDSASLTLSGYNVTVPYFAEGLSKIGVEASGIHIGDYKGSYENYSRSAMSNELESSYKKLYDDVHNEFLMSISKYRAIELDKVKALFESDKTVMITPELAKEYSLIDGFYYFEDLKKFCNPNYKGVNIYDYSKLLGSIEQSSKIAIIYAEGVISDGYAIGFNRDVVVYDVFRKDVREIIKNPSIKAVILRVNSPGGSALASELMLQELIELKRHKPLYVSFGPIAASGGYYIGCKGDRIFTSPSTIAGSIGVVSVLFNYVELAEKLGINFETVKKYKYDDLFSPNKKATADEISIMKNSMDKIYNEFTAHVIEGRGIEAAALKNIAEGRAWSGSQAVANGLADEIGGLFKTLDYAAVENNIKGYSILSYPRPDGLLDTLSSEIG
ncbi:MAG TPA: signal peptide peptidase SppA, partial [Spirochaetota bacterium]|nr:signal peptide peptidase SppA [Spirochaetota bacterium]